MVERKRVIQTILSHLREVLKPLGFRLRGQTFHRTGEDIVEMVNLQLYGAPGPLQATINVGVFSWEIARRRPDLHWDVRVPQEWDCQYRERIGYLMPDKADRWWPVNTEAELVAAAGEMTDGVKEHVLPALEEVNSMDKLYKFWMSGHGGGMSALMIQKYLEVIAPPGVEIPKAIPPEENPELIAANKVLDQLAQEKGWQISPWPSKTDIENEGSNDAKGRDV